MCALRSGGDRLVPTAVAHGVWAGGHTHPEEIYRRGIGTIIPSKRRIQMAETPINVAYPAAEDLHLRIALGACRFKAKPSDGEAWVTGTCHDPTDRRSPRVLEEG